MTQATKVLEALRESPRSTNYFTDALRIMQYNARIKDLRDRGYVIEAEHIEGSHWRYTLTSEPGHTGSDILPSEHRTHTRLVVGCPECIKVAA